MNGKGLPQFVQCTGVGSRLMEVPHLLLISHKNKVVHTEVGKMRL